MNKTMDRSHKLRLQRAAYIQRRKRVSVWRCSLRSTRQHRLNGSSKSRVAPSPKRALTIPRLELLSNLLAVTLGKNINKQCKGEKKVTVWTDSQIAQAWIAASNKNPEIWVQNRVLKIKEAGFHTRFCEGNLNPADHLPIGVKASTFEQTNWWDGPQWIINPDSYQPVNKSQSPPQLQINEIYVNWKRKREDTEKENVF